MNRPASTYAARFPKPRSQPGPDKAGSVVEITPELVADQLLIRAFSPALSFFFFLPTKTPERQDAQLEQRAATSLYFRTRPPAEVAALRIQPANSSNYWLKASPALAKSDARRGLVG